MKVLLKLTLIFLVLVNTASAQAPLVDRKTNQVKDKFSDHLFFGGSFGLQFGTQTYIELAPIIGYRFTENLSGGLGLKYIYYKYNDGYASNNSNIYGGGPFLRYFLMDGLFLHFEYEVLNLEVPDFYFTTHMRQNITSVFVGGGYRQMIGDRSALDLLLLYNINESRNSPYINPVIRIGFGFGI